MIMWIIWTCFYILRVFLKYSLDTLHVDILLLKFVCIAINYLDVLYFMFV